MATDFDQFPIYDPLIKEGTTLMSDVWVDFFATFFQTLIGYITQYGINPPNLTTTQRNTIINPQNGQIIYNTTVDAPQFYQTSSGTWRTYTFT
jgi:hypothetical protein